MVRQRPSTLAPAAGAVRAAVYARAAQRSVRRSVDFLELLQAFSGRVAGFGGDCARRLLRCRLRRSNLLMRGGGHFHDFIWPLSDAHSCLVGASEHPGLRTSGTRRKARFVPMGRRPSPIRAMFGATEAGVIVTHFAPALDLFTQKLDGIAWRWPARLPLVVTRGRTPQPAAGPSPRSCPTQRCSLFSLIKN
jgi:hypothetical protein